MKNIQIFSADVSCRSSYTKDLLFPGSAMFTLCGTEVSQRGGLNKMAAANSLWLQIETRVARSSLFFRSVHLPERLELLDSYTRTSCVHARFEWACL